MQTRSLGDKGPQVGAIGLGCMQRIGLSEAAPATIRRAHAVHPIAALSRSSTQSNRSRRRVA